MTLAIIIAGNNDTGDNLSPVLFMLVNSLSSILLTPAMNTKLRISPRIVLQIRNGPKRIRTGPGETYSCKKHEVENIVADSL
jgi:hypothetical protein